LLHLNDEYKILEGKIHKRNRNNLLDKHLEKGLVSKTSYKIPMLSPVTGRALDILEAELKLLAAGETARVI